ncbi:hypothetical protein LEO2_62 [Bacillus phage Leo2]|uniref:Uncharacterized protein n=1 Tax=Bacillus phage Leo2 TaxID=1815973 RepID=A0A1S5QTR2_9CAUD|nr:hypothetical protein LEO2_62 [Bacillus phage Leo2]
MTNIQTLSNNIQEQAVKTFGDIKKVDETTYTLPIFTADTRKEDTEALVEIKGDHLVKVTHRHTNKENPNPAYMYFNTTGEVIEHLTKLKKFLGN